MRRLSARRVTPAKPLQSQGRLHVGTRVQGHSARGRRSLSGGGPRRGGPSLSCASRHLGHPRERAPAPCGEEDGERAQGEAPQHCFSAGTTPPGRVWISGPREGAFARGLGAGPPCSLRTGPKGLCPGPGCAHAPPPSPPRGPPATLRASRFPRPRLREASFLRDEVIVRSHLRRSEFQN